MEVTRDELVSAYESAGGLTDEERVRILKRLRAQLLHKAVKNPALRRVPIIKELLSKPSTKGGLDQWNKPSNPVVSIADWKRSRKRT